MPPTYLPEGGCAALGALLAAGAAGLAEAIPALARAALAAGVTPLQLREALLMLVPFAGFPRALSTFAAAGLSAPAGPGVAVEAPVAERATLGRAAFDAVYGVGAPRVLAGLAALDPLLPAWTLEHAYGRVLARDGLALRDRELLAVALLSAMGGLDDPLLGHMRGALRLGARPSQIAAQVACVPAEAGEARRGAARSLLGRLTP